MGIREGLSVVMIVKNEEDVLESCLKSVRPIADEIVVVDTGSTDETVRIAEKYGAKIHYYEWDNNFSNARNYALKQASRKWILQMDADEYLDKENQQKINRMKRKLAKPVYTVEIKNLNNAGGVEVVHRNNRLFQNTELCAYRGMIHEQLQYRGKNIVGENSGLSIFHTGYMSERVEKQGKKERNFALLQESLRKEPNNPFHHTNIAEEYLHQKNYEEALKHSLYTVENGEGASFQLRSVTQAIKSYMRLERNEEALAFIEKVKQKERYKNDANISLLEATIFKKQGRNADAKIRLGQIIKDGTVEETFSLKEGMQTTQPLLLYIDILRSEKNYDKLLSVIQPLLNVNRNHFQLAEIEMRILRHVMSEEEMVEHLETNHKEEQTEQEVKAALYEKYRLQKGIERLVQKNEVREDDTYVRLNKIFQAYRNEKVEEFISVLKEEKEIEKWISLIYLFAFKTKKEQVLEQMGLEKNGCKEQIIDVIKECIKWKEYQHLTELFELVDDKTAHKVAETLEKYGYDEWALLMYIKALKNGEEPAILERVMELSHALKEDDLFFYSIQTLDEKESGNFRKIECLIEHFTEKEEWETVNEIVKSAKQSLPTSDYLRAIEREERK